VVFNSIGLALHPNATATTEIPDKELRIMNLLTRILHLESPNYDTLKVLVQHLAK
jgi:hypothetical protein